MPCSRLYASGQAVLPRCPDQTCRQRVRSRWSLGWRRPGYSRTCRPGIVYVLQGTITDHRDGIATERCRRRRSRSPSSGSNRRAAAEPAVSNGICRDLPCASFRRVQGCAGRLTECATWPILVVWVAFRLSRHYLVAESNSLTPDGAKSMTEPREKLSETQVRDASLADWRQILGRIKARFRTGDFRTGLALVNKSVPRPRPPTTTPTFNSRTPT